MELEIFWTQFAEDKLQDIFYYYKLKAGIKVAKTITTEIVDKTINLANNPKIGQIEEFLIERSQEFRYLVSTNYLETERLFIANVFDTRQNPEKLNETK